MNATLLPPQACILDLDGTLVDTLGDFVAVLGRVLCAALYPARAQEAPKPRVLKLLLLQDAPPLSHRDATGRFVGFNVDLGRLLCDTMRMSCEFQETVHTRVLDLVASGAVDIGMVSLIVTPERARQVLFTNPYRLSKTFWISRIPMTQSRQAKVAVVTAVWPILLSA